MAAQLLRELRRQIGESSIEFKEPPRRILGGFEAFTYSFELVVGQGDLSGPLILRLFPETSDAARGRKEAAFQNALHSLDYPAPRVVFNSDAGIGGLPFNLMKRVPGSPTLAGMALDQNTVQQASVKLGEVHARFTASRLDRSSLPWKSPVLSWPIFLRTASSLESTGISRITGLSGFARAWNGSCSIARKASQ